ncbi:8644_t:CDS:1 [Diversispora eburnea]|uniref:8644_t:CDS:1 n=1 Tax=Diversispora eburnea TaxID=1213867 RepID=A0A9N8YMQ5_9GLOM|nr:8644_t:CDS:1 [Diversispora eburnea]
MIHPVKNINDILNYANNLQDHGFENQDHELILNPPYQLTLSLDSLLLLARRNRKNKINKIPRPQNAWVLFRKDYEANKRIQFPDQIFKMKTVSINTGDEWKI